MEIGAIRRRWLPQGSGEAIKSVLAGLLILALATCVSLAYRSYAGRQRNNGDVTGDTADTGPGRRDPAPVSRSAAADPSSDGPAPTLAGAAPKAGAGTTSTDTIAPNPPNGLAFGGSGHFQVYRQGDITWRLNTESGETCVLFATDAEWRQPRIRRASCSRSKH